MDQPQMLAEEREAADAPEDERALRFGDEAWDDEFCTWLDNGLRTCCG